VSLWQMCPALEQGRHCTSRRTKSSGRRFLRIVIMKMVVIWNAFAFKEVFPVSLIEVVWRCGPGRTVVRVGCCEGFMAVIF
jgi:hypothetical protein